MYIGLNSTIEEKTTKNLAMPSLHQSDTPHATKLKTLKRNEPQEGCDRHPSFGWKHADGKARRCAHHRLEGMESVKVNNRRGSAAAAANALKAKQAR